MMSAMDFLVKQGKVRYLGLSDHPAWVVTKCQYTALMRGWEPLCALQIEYSLLQRTVESDLMTMARDLGLGVTPWSPLRGGVLSGKFDRNTPPPADGSTRVKQESNYLNERSYALIDLLREIAAAHGCTVAQVALRWVLDQQGVTSVIIGARRLNQLHDNLGCCAVKLTADDHRRLDEASRVERPFPWDFLDFVRAGIQNGSTINGVKSDLWHLTPKSDDERF
jgi:aryl-alcohol dehydrogenase-like predicted oxidoreductase